MTDGEYLASQAALREAATPEVLNGPGTVGQGVRGEPTPSGFTIDQLNDHAFYMANKAEILAAAAQGDLPGQGAHTTNSLDL